MRYCYIVTVLIVLGGCAFNNHSSNDPELHAIGVYHGKRENQLPPQIAQQTPGGFEVSSDYRDGGREALEVPKYRDNRPKKIKKKPGAITVNVSIENKPLILAFSAYEKTVWNVKLKQNVVIEKVILSGYHQQQVKGIPEETLIEVYTYDSSPCERCYQGQGYFYSYKSPPESKLKEISGLQIRSWQGKYSGEEFSIFPNIPKFNKE